jgi:hypothetical protein
MDKNDHTPTQVHPDSALPSIPYPEKPAPAAPIKPMYGDEPRSEWLPDRASSPSVPSVAQITDSDIAYKFARALAAQAAPAAPQAVQEQVPPEQRAWTPTPEPFGYFRKNGKLYERLHGRPNEHTLKSGWFPLWTAPSSTEARATAPEVRDAARDVLAERQRQISVEGWVPEHDDQYVSDELAQAAACYAMSFADQHNYDKPMSFWPWDMAWWKPQGARRNLVKAGALILAEIERMDRVALRTPSPSQAPASGTAGTQTGEQA